jgi:hypothetical protein
MAVQVRGVVLKKEIEEFTRYRFSTTRIGDTQKLLHENGMFIMVPVSKYHCEVCIIRVHFSRWMENEGRAQTVDVLTLSSKARWRLDDTADKLRLTKE